MLLLYLPLLHERLAHQEPHLPMSFQIIGERTSWAPKHKDRSRFRSVEIPNKVEHSKLQILFPEETIQQ